MRLIEVQNPLQMARVMSMNGVQPEMARVLQVDGRDYLLVPEADPTKATVGSGYATAVGRAGGASEIGVGYWRITVASSENHNNPHASGSANSTVTNEALQDIGTGLDYTDTLAEVSDSESDPAMLVLSSLRLRAVDTVGGGSREVFALDPSGALSMLSAPTIGGATPNRVDPLTGEISITTDGSFSAPQEMLATYDVTAWPGVSEFPRFCYIERIVILAEDSATHANGTIDLSIYEDAGCRLTLFETTGITINADDTAMVDVGRSSVAQSIRSANTGKRYIKLTTDHKIDIRVFAYWRRSR